MNIHTNQNNEDIREQFLVRRDGVRKAAKWYIRTARIYRNAAISKSEKFDKRAANLYIAGSEDCFARGKELRTLSNKINEGE